MTESPEVRRVGRSDAGAYGGAIGVDAVGQQPDDGRQDGDGEGQVEDQRGSHFVFPFRFEVDFSRRGIR
jgi:hypothetical protein